MYYFVDFDDSFSNNILCELGEYGVKPNVIHWKSFSFSTFSGNINPEDKVILGPGPGEPNEYSLVFNVIEILLQQGTKFIGICLGHQILSIIKGFNCLPAKEIYHGISQEIELDSNWKKFLNIDDNFINVQRYNSLAIEDTDTELDKLVIDDEIMALKGKNIFSMQFHPESIGTYNRKCFFEQIIKV